MPVSLFYGVVLASILSIDHRPVQVYEVVFLFYTFCFFVCLSRWLLWLCLRLYRVGIYGKRHVRQMVVSCKLIHWRVLLANICGVVDWLSKGFWTSVITWIPIFLWGHRLAKQDNKFSLMRSRRIGRFGIYGFFLRDGWFDLVFQIPVGLNFFCLSPPPPPSARGCRFPAVRCRDSRVFCSRFFRVADPGLVLVLHWDGLHSIVSIQTGIWVSG